MKKAELIAAIAKDTGYSQTQVKDTIDSLARISTNELRAEGETILPGLGKLATSKRNARQGRNPATGEAVQIPASVSVKFKAASDLKAAVQ